MSISNIIAEQLHHTKPEHLRPGADVGMIALPNALGVYIGPLDRLAVVNYDEGADHYDVAVVEASAVVGVPTVAGITAAMEALHSVILNGPRGIDGVLHGVYCDQIGEFVWGDDAEDFTMPMVAITTWDADGNEQTDVIA